MAGYKFQLATIFAIIATAATSNAYAGFDRRGSYYVDQLPPLPSVGGNNGGVYSAVPVPSIPVYTAPEVGGESSVVPPAQPPSTGAYEATLPPAPEVGGETECAPLPAPVTVTNTITSTDTVVNTVTESVTETSQVTVTVPVTQVLTETETCTETQTQTQTTTVTTQLPAPAPVTETYIETQILTSTVTTQLPAPAPITEITTVTAPCAVPTGPGPEVGGQPETSPAAPSGGYE
ncbi:hypothetical protein EV182_007777, partial [Spiromyces aspiralis]